MKKRGLSAVVTTLIIILLVLVAVGVVWVVIANLITEGAEQVSLGKFTINMEIKNVEVDSSAGTVDVKVKRNPGKGELSGIKFLVSDGIEVQEFEEETTIGELGQKTFTLNYDGLVKDVSIAPILESESGKEFVGNEIDAEKLNNKEIIKDLGGVSWWRLEGNGQDEIGGNHGELIGDVHCDVEGKYGNACEFDGGGDYIELGTSNELKPIGDFSLSFWVELSVPCIPATGCGAATNWHVYFWESYRNHGWTTRAEGETGNILFRTSQSASSSSFQSTSIGNNELHHGVLVYSGGTATWYLDGEFDATASITPAVASSSAMVYIGGAPSQSMNGILDEVMIFNRALNSQQVKALHELDLS